MLKDLRKKCANLHRLHCCAENRGEFLEKLQRVRGQVKPGTPSQPILSKSGNTRLSVGNWTLACKKDGELQIQNSDGQQVNLSVCL